MSAQPSHTPHLAPSPRPQGSLAAATWLAIGLGLAVLISGCAPTVPVKPAPPPPTLAELMQRPAERALFEGIRHYDEGQYEQAETQLRRALATGLADPRDRASAHKLLAFITCTSTRLEQCATEFVAARAADPHFQLSRSESGHPVWGPVYRRTLAP